MCIYRVRSTVHRYYLTLTKYYILSKYVPFTTMYSVYSPHCNLPCIHCIHCQSVALSLAPTPSKSILDQGAHFDPTLIPLRSSLQSVRPQPQSKSHSPLTPRLLLANVSPPVAADTAPSHHTAVLGRDSCATNRALRRPMSLQRLHHCRVGKPTFSFRPCTTATSATPAACHVPYATCPTPHATCHMPHPTSTQLNSTPNMH